MFSKNRVGSCPADKSIQFRVRHFEIELCRIHYYFAFDSKFSKKSKIPSHRFSIQKLFNMQVRNVAMLLFAPADKSKVGGADDGMRFKELRQLSLVHLPMPLLHLKLQKSIAL